MQQLTDVTPVHCSADEVNHWGQCGQLAACKSVLGYKGPTQGTKCYKDAGHTLVTAHTGYSSQPVQDTKCYKHIDTLVTADSGYKVLQTLLITHYS